MELHEWLNRFTGMDWIHEKYVFFYSGVLRTDGMFIDTVDEHRF